MADFLDVFIKIILGFGVAGLFALAILDSTIFFFLPFAVDAVLIVLVSQNRDTMPIYALVTVAGSLAGCAITFLLVRKVSQETLEKKFSKKKFKKVAKKVKDKGLPGLIITSLLPPPFPFSPFVAAAAVTKVPPKKAFFGIAIGRSLRYFGEGLLALVIGNQILRLLNSGPFKAFMLGLFVLAAAGTAFSIYKWVKR
jgi:membrane protein YqaA with SNARE-associated domain